MSNKSPPNLRSSIFAIACVIALVVVTFTSIVPRTHADLFSWYSPVVTPEEVHAALWADENLPAHSLFAADLFACEMMVSAARMVCTIGGAWELADRANQRFADNEKVFTTNDSAESFYLLTSYGVEYVLVHPRTSFYGFGWKPPNLALFSNSSLFELIYDMNATRIYRVKQP